MIGKGFVPLFIIGDRIKSNGIIICIVWIPAEMCGFFLKVRNFPLLHIDNCNRCLSNTRSPGFRCCYLKNIVTRRRGDNGIHLIGKTIRFGIEVTHSKFHGDQYACHSLRSKCFHLNKAAF